MEFRRKVLIVCGPTATGKTDLAIKIARRFNGEIVSADSRQVYQYMDIGTGKDLPTNSKSEIRNPKQISNSKFQIQNHEIKSYKIKGIKLWLYDIVQPDYQFNVADYVNCADLVIKDIWQRGKLPILVGGTGLYIKALIDGIQTLGIVPDWELRKRLTNCSMTQLSDKLKKLNPQKWQSMNYSDRNNPRRLVRAIEIAKIKRNHVILGTQSEAWRTPESNKKGFWTSQNDDNLLMIGLTAPYKILYERIDQRVDGRVKQGVEKEIKQLLLKGYDWNNSAMGVTIGHKEWEGVMREVAIQRWKFDEHGYARRQITWFKKDKRIHWFDIEEKNWQQAVEKEVVKWYND